MAKKPTDELIVTEEVAEVKPPQTQTATPQPPQTPQNPPATAPSSGYKPLGEGSMANANKHIWSQADRDALENVGNQYSDTLPEADRIQLHKDAEAIRGKWGYSGGPDGSEYKPNADPLTNNLNAWRDMAMEQAQKQNDFAVQQGVTELERAEADAQPKFDKMQAQNASESRKALDNHALYMEARGDRGGIGHAQYGQIQAQALRNQQSINEARTKLATDTARKIADLRAQGEFKKADDILKIGQLYLQQMNENIKWGMQYELSIKQMNEQIRQWEASFEAEIGQMMGEYKGKPTFQASEAAKDRLIASGQAALANGVRPTPEQMAAMGMTADQVNKIISDYQIDRQLELAVKRQSLANSRGGGGGGGGGPKKKKNDEDADSTLDGMSLVERRDALFQAALDSGDPEHFLENTAAYKDYGFSKAFTYDDLLMWQDEQKTLRRRAELTKHREEVARQVREENLRKRAEFWNDHYPNPSGRDIASHDRTPMYDIVSGMQSQYGGR